MSRGDTYRDQSHHYDEIKVALAETATTAEEWAAVNGLADISRHLWSVGAWLDLHDKKYGEK